MGRRSLSLTRRAYSWTGSPGSRPCVRQPARRRGRVGRLGCGRSGSGLGPMLPGRRQPRPPHRTPTASRATAPADSGPSAARSSWLPATWPVPALQPAPMEGPAARPRAGPSFDSRPALGQCNAGDEGDPALTPPSVSGSGSGSAARTIRRGAPALVPVGSTPRSHHRKFRARKLCSGAGLPNVSTPSSGRASGRAGPPGDDRALFSSRDGALRPCRPRVRARQVLLSCRYAV
jgi:hypothetical protein